MLPGVLHRLELDPAGTLLLLGTSSTPGLTFDLARMMHPRVYIWPKFYVQAATFTAFGPAVAARFR